MNNTLANYKHTLDNVNKFAISDIMRNIIHKFLEKCYLRSLDKDYNNRRAYSYRVIRARFNEVMQHNISRYSETIDLILHYNSYTDLCDFIKSDNMAPGFYFNIFYDFYEMINDRSEFLFFRDYLQKKYSDHNLEICTIDWYNI